MKIACIGMLVCDISLSPVPEDILTKDSSRINAPIYSCGGDALNVAISLKKLGLDASISGRIGDDVNGKFLIDQCEKFNIDSSNVIKDDQFPTAVSYVLIDENGERHFLSENSVFARTAFRDIDLGIIQRADYVYFGSAIAMSAMNDGGLASLFKIARNMGKMTVLDAATNDDISNRDWLEVLGSTFYETDIFFPSLTEATAITGETDPVKIAGCFKDFGMKAFGIKLGSKGCYVTDFHNDKFIPGIQNIHVVDTTGAGDSFMAGLMCGLAHNFNLFESAEFANAVSALNISSVGATSGIPDFDEAKNYFCSIKGSKGVLH